MPIEAYLPPHLPPERVAARIGLISDTHMPQRCATFPESLFEVLRGADLLLHAGDVGALWVLDRLSQIGPLVAVHGNDETAEASRELPYRQLLSAAGLRLLLWHSHYPNRAEELASRRGDDLRPKLARQIERARRAGAGLVVFGHWHIPLTYRLDGVLAVNPGALASGNFITHQTRQTVAALFVRDDGTPFISHIDLAAPGEIYHPQIDWDGGFAAALGQYSRSILGPELAARRKALFDLWETFEDVAVVEALILRLAHRCWSGAQQEITLPELLFAVRNDPALTAGDRKGIEEILLGSS